MHYEPGLHECTFLFFDGLEGLKAGEIESCQVTVAAKLLLLLLLCLPAAQWSFVLDFERRNLSLLYSRNHLKPIYN